MQQGQVIKKFTSKKGKEVIFRFPKQSDVVGMLDFINTLITEDTYIMRHKNLVTLEEEQQYVDGLLQAIEKRDKYHITVETEGKIVGNAEVRKQKHRQSHVGELGISLLPEIRGEGIGEALLSALIEEGRTRGLKLLVLNVFEGNNIAQNLYKKLGFKEAGVVPGAVFFKGDYIGEHRMYLNLA